MLYVIILFLLVLSIHQRVQYKNLRESHGKAITVMREYQHHLEDTISDLELVVEKLQPKPKRKYNRKTTSG